MHRVWDFCFIDAWTILLAISIAHGWDSLQAISLSWDKDGVPGVWFDLPEDYQHCSLELKTDGGRLIGLCVGIDRVVQYAYTQDSDSDYLLIIDRPGLLKFCTGAQDVPMAVLHDHEWACWGPEITTILPLENNSYQMAWAVFGRRIVINAEAGTLPFAKSVLEERDKKEAEGTSHEDNNNRDFEDQEDSHSGERLVVVDFGSYGLTSVAEAGDDSANIIRCRPQGDFSLVGVRGMFSEGRPCRIWMERVPSCLPSGQVHMSENMVLVSAVSC